MSKTSIDKEKALTEWIYRTFGSRKEYGSKEFRDSVKGTVGFSFYLLEYKIKNLGMKLVEDIIKTIEKVNQ